MGVQDRDWYQEHWRRNVLGIEPEDERRALRRARRQRRSVPADVARFWRVFLFVMLCAFWLVVLRLLGFPNG